MTCPRRAAALSPAPLRRGPQPCAGRDRKPLPDAHAIAAARACVLPPRLASRFVPSGGPASAVLRTCTAAVKTIALQRGRRQPISGGGDSLGKRSSRGSAHARRAAASSQLAAARPAISTSHACHPPQQPLSGGVRSRARQVAQAPPPPPPSLR